MWKIHYHIIKQLNKRIANTNELVLELRAELDQFNTLIEHISKPQCSTIKNKELNFVIFLADPWRYCNNSGLHNVVTFFPSRKEPSLATIA